MQNKFESLNFDDVNVTFDNGCVAVKASDYNRSIDFNNLDSVAYKTVITRRINELNLAARSTALFGISAILFALVSNSCGGSELESFAFKGNVVSIFFGWLGLFSAIACFLSMRLIWGGSVMGSFFGVKVWNNVMNKYFSNHNYHVTIGSKNGKDLNFLTDLTDIDKDKIEKLKTIVEQIKSTLYQESIKSTKEASKPNDYIKELNSLNELLKNGVITQEEFDLKKKKILGL